MLELDDIAAVVAGAVRDATTPLLARIDALERRELTLAETLVAGNFKGEPGESVDMAEVGRLIETAVESAVKALPAPRDGEPGKDGVGLADALRDAEGGLVLVMTDGRTKSLGKIDGEDGLPGKDGLGFDDLNVEQIGERTVRFLLRRDADEAEFDVTFPMPIYRGVFKDGQAYEPGDMVTWGGSLWHCDKATSEKPGPDNWRMAVKKGRDGKDAGK
jgi:hypothetical protein